MTDDKVSVIVPVYNKEALIQMCLRSLLEQTHQNLEVIVYDDASTDGSVEKVKELDDPRIVLIEGKTNRGPGFGRNRAMEAATGQWIAMQDADDMSNIYRIALQLKAIEISRRSFSCVERRITRVLHRMEYRILPGNVSMTCAGLKSTIPSTILPARPIVPFSEDIPWHHELLWSFDVKSLYGLPATVHPGLYYRNMGDQPDRICNDMLDKKNAEKVMIRSLSYALFRERQWHCHERLQELRAARAGNGVPPPDRSAMLPYCRHKPQVCRRKCVHCTDLFIKWLETEALPNAPGSDFV